MKKKQYAAIVIAVLLLLATGVLGVSMASGRSDVRSRNGKYISVINIYGTIGDVRYDLFGDEVSLSAGAIIGYLEEVAEDDKNCGLFLNIESPGGSVYETDKIYCAIMDYKEKTGREVIASCHSTMCSGAYYIACAADTIYAEKTSTVGSIGVYMEMVNISELCDKLGIDVDYIRSSENKAMGNMYNPLTEEQRAIYQAMIDEDYERFVQIVMDSRGYEDIDALKAICDGRSYSATQALENGLIDGLMENRDVIYMMQEDMGVYRLDYPYVKSEGLISSLISDIIDSLPISEATLLKKLMEGKSGRAMYYAG